MALCSVARLPRREPSQQPTTAALSLATAGGSHATVLHIDASQVDIELLPRLLPRDIARASLIDPHDETLEIEITEDMVNMALEAVDEQQLWPYAADRRLVARPVRCARIIRFPGC